MILDWSTIADYALKFAGLAVCALFGASFRAAYALYCIYQERGYFRPDWWYVASFVACSAFFGDFAAFVLNEFGVIAPGARFGIAGLALLGGVLGPNLMDKIPKNFGLDPDFVKAMDRVPSDLNENQRKAIEYARNSRGLRNDDYQRLNSVGDTTATKELGYLVSKGYLKREGIGRATRYVA